MPIETAGKAHENVTGLDDGIEMVLPVNRAPRCDEGDVPSLP